MSEVSFSIEDIKKGTFSLETKAENFNEEKKERKRGSEGSELNKLFFKTNDFKALKEWLLAFRLTKCKMGEERSKQQETAISVSDNKLEPPSLAYQIPFEYIKSSKVPLEQVEWLNVLMQRHYEEMTCSWIFKHKTSVKVQKQLDKMFAKNRGVSLPSNIGPLKLERIFRGQSFVRIEGIRLDTTENMNEFVGQVELNYNGGAGVEISTFLDFPLPFGNGLSLGRLPIKLLINFKKVKGTLYVYAPKLLHKKYGLTFEKMPECQFEVKVKVGKNQFEITQFATIKEFVEEQVKKSFAISFTRPSQMHFFIPFPGRPLGPKIVKVRGDEGSSKKRKKKPVQTLQIKPAFDQVEQQIANWNNIVKSFIQQVFNKANFLGETASVFFNSHFFESDIIFLHQSFA